jgi:hypothetical protein
VSVRLPLAFLLGVATAVLVACGGGSSDKLLSQSRADLIKSDLADVRQAVNQQACDQAQQALQKLDSDLDGMPASVDQRLRDRLQEGYRKLAQRVPIDCNKPTTTTTTTVPTTTETTPTTTETTPTTTETTPTATETTPTTTTPPDTTTTDGSSGSGGVTAP